MRLDSKRRFFRVCDNRAGLDRRQRYVAFQIAILIFVIVDAVVAQHEPPLAPILYEFALLGQEATLVND